MTLSELYPALDELPQKERDRLAGALHSWKVANGAIVFDERDPCRGFPFLFEGAIRVVKPAPNGRELPLYDVLPGESCIISVGCLLGKASYQARGYAVGATTIGLLPLETFERLLAHAPFRRFVFATFSERLAELMQLVEEIAFRKLDARLAARLLGRGRHVHLTHQQLADELGTVREMVSRLLKGFADQGFVRLARNEIEILDPAGLRRIADL
ncbi:MAG: Crp/Fnr family transcriptional regulator [Rhodocyclaceae bacterium]|nr:Crp/Fnr family transcriptional regulator [Rhodocyclaceae bacterium]